MKNIFFHPVLDAIAIPQNISETETVYFPDLEGDQEREFGNARAQSRIPVSLLIERGANGLEMLASWLVSLSLFFPCRV